MTGRWDRSDQVGEHRHSSNTSSCWGPGTTLHILTQARLTLKSLTGSPSYPVRVFLPTPFTQMFKIATCGCHLWIHWSCLSWLSGCWSLFPIHDLDLVSSFHFSNLDGLFIVIAYLVFFIYQLIFICITLVLCTIPHTYTYRFFMCNMSVLHIIFTFHSVLWRPFLLFGFWGSFHTTRFLIAHISYTFHGT